DPAGFAIPASNCSDFSQSVVMNLKKSPPVLHNIATNRLGINPSVQIKLFPGVPVPGTAGMDKSLNRIFRFDPKISGLAPADNPIPGEIFIRKDNRIPVYRHQRKLFILNIVVFQSFDSGFIQIDFPPEFPVLLEKTLTPETPVK